MGVCGARWGGILITFLCVGMMCWVRQLRYEFGSVGGEEAREILVRVIVR